MTLTEISYYARRAAPFVLIFCLIFLIIFYTVRLVIVVLKGGQGQPIQINAVFGKIKPPVIPESSSSAGLSFTLDTVEGEPITATDTAKVIFLPPPKATFGYREKIYLVAKTIGFDTEVVRHKQEGSEALFEDEKQKVSIDVSNFNFTYQYFFERDEGLFEKVGRPARERAEESATAFLQTIGRYPQELTQGKTSATFLSYDPKEKTITTLPNNIGSNLVEIDFYRPDIDGYPTVSSTYFSSQNFVLLALDETAYKALRAQIRYFEKSDDQVGIYPLRSGQNAFDKLKKGKGYVVSNPQERKNVVIKKMFLGYYDPEIYQDFLQPVYVFLGDDQFVAYVAAITDKYLAE